MRERRLTSRAGASLREQIGERGAAVARATTTAVDRPDHVMQTLPGPAGERSLGALGDGTTHELRHRRALERSCPAGHLIQMIIEA
jgi:hypothetical protein